MHIGLAFWIVWFIALLFGAGWIWVPGRVGPYAPTGAWILIMILLFFLGWNDFGFFLRD